LLHILSGPDSYSRGQALETIKGSIGDPEAMALNTAILEGRQLTVDQMRPVCEAMPFLAEKRLVIITGLLQRFEAGKRATGTARGRRKTTSAQDHKSLGEYIPAIPESTVMVLVDEKVSAGNPLYKILSAKARVQSFPLLNTRDLREWLQAYIAQEGGSISSPAVNLLARLVGSDLWTMSSEAGKLLLYTSGRRIEEEDIRLLVGYTQQANVFAMVDAIVEFRAQPAEKMLQQLLQQGAVPGYLLSMLTRQMRLIVRAREINNPRISSSELCSRLGIANDYVARKTLEQSRHYSLLRIRHVYRKLLETDIAIKTGKYEPELALSILVAELCQQHAA